MILYINACVREESRTARLAEALLQKLGGEYTELCLEEENILPLDRKALAERTALIDAGDYSSPRFERAKQFAAADTIVISAPFWDLSFPAMLKCYLENIYVTGIVSKYSDEGLPVGLCRADKLYYVSTSGGPFIPDYSFNYIRDLATQYFGIGDVQLIKAEWLDIVGNDPEAIVSDAIAGILSGNGI